MDKQKKQQILSLLEKFAAQTISADEQQEFNRLITSLSNAEYREITEGYEQYLSKYEIAEEVDPILLQKISQRLDEYDQQAPQRIQTHQRRYRIAVAASIIALLAISGYYIINKKQTAITNQYAQNDIPYGTQHAILKIGKQQKISLDNTKNGLIASQASASISKTADGSISYQNTTKTEIIAAPVYDTIEIPAGGRTYHLQLADGSKVLLNAATSLRFPEIFNGNERPEIELITGEAYFEIIHNEKAPLHIKAPHQAIEDIGTKFNIRAYPDDENTATTLAEGAIKVKTGTVTKQPNPGEQAIYANNKLTIAAANLTNVLAWTNGFFRFNDETITEVMKELARWYNIEVKYEGPITKEHFNAKISRYKNISAVLRVLERTKGVHFKIEGRRVTVLNKP